MNNRLHDLRALVSMEVKTGFANREDIIELALDYLLDTFDYNPELLDLEAVRVTDELLAQHHAEQQKWLHITDCDRLDEAFAELDRNGIVARHNFTCCQTCGHAEIGYEIDQASAHREIRGYVFYHQQDTESAAHGEGLYLAYGAVSGTEDDSLVIGWQIVNSLERQGLQVEWNGMIQKRIYIPNLVWEWRRI